MTFALDRRTRRDDEYRPIEAARFFVDDFPKLVAVNGPRVGEGLSALKPPPLTIEVGAKAWTIVQAADTVALWAGARDGALIVRLTPDQFSKWAQNQITLNGLLVAQSLDFTDGTLADISAWDSLWIALLEGWPVVDPELAFRDRRGQPLDLAETFTVDDDPEDIAHFLREAGFVLLRGWLDPVDLAPISEEMDAALSDYVEGDGKSWWATLNDGSRRAVRLQEFVERSPATAAILSGARWDQLRRTLGGADSLARRPVTGRIIEALFKPVGVVSGPSDLSFHRDCHLGRHAYDCSSIVIGVPLTPADGESGMLRVVAGSHRLVMPVEVAKTRSYLPVVALPANPGDITVHLSCTLHEAQAPVSAERRVMYTGFSLEKPASAGPVDGSASELRERVSDILRDQGVATASGKDWEK